MPNSATSSTAFAPYSHVIRQGDTLPVMVCSLTDDAGNIVPLTGKAVAFHMRNAQTKVPVILTGTASVTSITNGEVQYAFTSVDTANYGTFEGVFIVTTTATNDVESFPNGAVYLEISITKGL